MLLAIDAGNTRTKWAVFNKAGEIKHLGACLNEVLATADLSLSSLAYDRVVISNVAGKSHAALLAEKLAAGANALPVRWITATTQACGVRNSYLPTETLGCDRWAALIAAWHIKQAPCVVVNAGTAVTIDALSIQSHSNSQAEFIGGLILPGLNLMQQSLALATAQLPMPALLKSGILAAQCRKDIFPKNTVDAIYAGALQAICGAITQMSGQLKTQCKQTPTIIISGGNAQVIKDNLMDDLTNHTLIIDNLVLYGLYLMEKMMLKKIMQGELQ